MKPLIGHRCPPRARVLLDHELCIVRANRSMCRSFGVPQDSLIGTRVDEWINVDATLMYGLRSRIVNGSMPWHVILRLRLSGLQIMVVSQILQPLRSRRSGYLLISLADIQVA